MYLPSTLLTLNPRACFALQVLPQLYNDHPLCPNNSRFSRADAGLGPRNVANIASANCGDEIVPISAPRYGRTVLSEEQGKVVARVHGGHVREELLNILRVKLARNLAIVHKAIMPSLAGLIRTDAALKSDERQLGLR
jgi:hypothetical protein